MDLTKRHEIMVQHWLEIKKSPEKDSHQVFPPPGLKTKTAHSLKIITTLSYNLHHQIKLVLKKFKENWLLYL